MTRRPSSSWKRWSAWRVEASNILGRHGESSWTRYYESSLTFRPIIFEYIETLLGSAQSYSVLLIERAVVGLLRLCLIISESVSQADLN